MGDGVGQHPSFRTTQEQMQRKAFANQYPKRKKEKDVDQDKTHNWPSTPGLKSGTEGFIIAAQDQCIKTNYY